MPDKADLESAKRRMLDRHLSGRGIRSPSVLAAMAKVPRQRFLPKALLDEAYADRALPIECEQTISQPYIVALMTQALELSGQENVLEIGTGSGYQTAVLAELASQVVTIERHAPLSAGAGQTLAELDYENVTLLVGDGTLGHADRAPYDRIIVTATAERYPAALYEQLRTGGILVMPIGRQDKQVLQAVRKTASGPTTTNLSGCRFVPLIGEQGWPE